ncbi:AAA family ATPase [Fructobacillus parabroussonetiae]|uniref:AAA family ATPase n=1 Tax=Fructobacillus parabroussonetiae TaxID=2713174 RepID=UPI003242CF9B
MKKFQRTFGYEFSKKNANESIIPLKNACKQVEDDLDEAQRKQEQLINASQDESMAAKRINTLLKGAGGISFELRLNTKASEQGHKGIYEIVQKNEEGKYIQRDIESLSDGEKNIVSFLWFIYNLDNVKNSEQERVILFDDPMNSNDDGYQYLIIAILNSYIDNHQKDQLFILTHNNHFFAQVKPNSINYQKKGVFFLQKDEKTKIKRILKQNDDLQPIYDTLWEELKFAYSSGKTIFMWNNMRRILETYNRFRFMKEASRDIQLSIEDSENKILAISLVKSLHVNSHIGYGTDIDISGKNPEQLINAFREVFKSIGALDDFNVRWPNDN